ncbi:MAG TPA: hypothetical protein VFN91_06605, partial [Myxococcaceae bacterium]|nr:hypothetical protein [Myxococcaceae bacterium]
MRRKVRWLFAVLGLGAAAVSAACSGGTAPAPASTAEALSQGPRYVVTPLGSLGGTSSQGNSINDLGWVGG